MREITPRELWWAAVTATFLGLAVGFAATALRAAWFALQPGSQARDGLLLVTLLTLLCLACGAIALAARAQIEPAIETPPTGALARRRVVVLKAPWQVR